MFNFKHKILAYARVVLFTRFACSIPVASKTKSACRNMIKIGTQQKWNLKNIEIHQHKKKKMIQRGYT